MKLLFCYLEHLDSWD